MRTGKIVLAMLTAGAVGAALGILIAPDKGATTRKKIRKSGDKLAKDLNKKIDHKLSELIDTVAGVNETVLHGKKK